jgi:hypothetical protein
MVVRPQKTARALASANPLVFKRWRISFLVERLPARDMVRSVSTVGVIL